MRHRFHALCPYFAMFPEQFVEKHLIWSKPGELVLDPFCGRGTTVFESLLRGREALGGDTNPVAVCVSGAKVDPPSLREVLGRLGELQNSLLRSEVLDADLPCGEFFGCCFHRSTLRQIIHLRKHLRWRRNRTDRFIAALILGCLHGESHRTQWCFSNRMPRTISTKPAYSVRWWRKNRCLPPERDVFAILRAVATFRYESSLPLLRGRVASSDARRICDRFPDAKSRVSLVITSPPYLDTTDYGEDQWLRLWFLGGPEAPERRHKSDDRHRSGDSYWKFLTEAWAGVAPLLRDGAQLVIRIGGRHIDIAEAESKLRVSLRRGTGATVRLLERRGSRITHGQLRAFRPGASGTQVEHDLRFRIG
jgi:DNA methylase